MQLHLPVQHMNRSSRLRSRSGEECTQFDPIDWKVIVVLVVAGGLHLARLDRYSYLYSSRARYRGGMGASFQTRTQLACPTFSDSTTKGCRKPRLTSAPQRVQSHTHDLMLQSMCLRLVRSSCVSTAPVRVLPRFARNFLAPRTCPCEDSARCIPTEASHAHCSHAGIKHQTAPVGEAQPRFSVARQ